MQPVSKWAEPSATQHRTSTCIDWYAEGQVRVVEVDGIQVTVRFVGRKGRRARIVIEAPAGAVFRDQVCGSSS